ncbi:MAG: FapA family protein [Lachnospiraceae bacterium]|nr:FapA family protein [Lachnospiraceae bacterium]
MTVQEKLRLMKDGFTKEQVNEIQLGEEAYLDTSYYARKEFLPLQMKEIRLGMEMGLEIEIYARPDFDWLQMEEIRLGLENEINVKKYAFPKVPHDIMRELRVGFEEGVDLSPYISFGADVLRELRYANRSGAAIIPYAQKGFDAEQLMQIRLAIEHSVPIELFINEAYRGIALQEIRVGLEHRVDVSTYANVMYDWRQMREMRLGLEHQVNVEEYHSPMYDWKQMREIRTGLEEGLNVDYYKNLMYTGREMKRRREYMLTHLSGEFIGKDGPTVVTAEHYSITISPDKLQAKICMVEQDKSANFKGIINLLKDKGVIYGVKEDVIRELITGNLTGQNVVVAEGRKPEKGRDGYYEFFFRTDFSRKPKEREDGSLDYTDIEWFEQVVAGQKLALYHEPEDGTEGMTVTGTEIQTTKGKPLSVLHGKGIRLDEDCVTYVADASGYVEYKQRDNTLEVHNLLQMEEVNYSTGKVIFDGDLLVKGNVTEGSVIDVSGDIIIDGMVEGAEIKAGGDIVIRKGVNASGKGSIISKKNISTNFLEYGRAVANENITGNYFLNSNVHAGKNVTISGKKGTIVGGVTYAMNEIKVNSVGNDASVRTELKLGFDDQMLDRSANIDRQLVNISAEISSLMDVEQQLTETLGKDKRRENDMYLKVESALSGKVDAQKRLVDQRKEMDELFEKTEHAKAVIQGKVNDNVRVVINGREWISRGTSGGVTIQLVNNEVLAR